MRHEYIGKVASDEEQERQAERDRLDAQWKRKRIDAESARQKLHQAKLLEMKGELISRRHVTKQASFLVLSLRARLLALGGTLAPRIARACGGEERAIESLIDAEVREALSEISEMPQRVVDPHWIETLDENEATSAQKRPPRQ